MEWQPRMDATAGRMVDSERGLWRWVLDNANVFAEQPKKAAEKGVGNRAHTKSKARD